MPLNLDQKKAIVADFAAIAANATAAVGADYRGLTVSEMDSLRVEARKSNVHLRVVRNNLVKRAVEGTEFSCIKESLVGPLVLAFSQEEPSASARLLKDFAKEHEKLQVKFLSVGGQLLDGKDIDVLAKLPTRDQAISILMSVMQAPTTKFVQTLAAVPTKLVRTLAAIRDQKQSA